MPARVTPTGLFFLVAGWVPRLTFRTLLELLGRQMQTCLNERMIEDAVLFAAGHKRKASYIGEHSSRAILPVEPQQRAFLRKVGGSQIPTNGGEPLAQFLPISPIASVAKRAEPVERVGLTDGSPCANDFSPLTPRVARRADLIQSTERWGQVVCLR